jgi:hypothetical protein
MSHPLIRSAAPEAASSKTGPLEVDRRTTLLWLAAAMAAAAPLAACGESKSGFLWAVPTTRITAKGYGKDPKLNEPTVPWPLTLTRMELAACAALCDLILPADGDAPSASALSVPAFLNEWVSAPYPDQQKDRDLIVPGLAWLDAETQKRGFGSEFAHASLASQKAIADDIAFKGKVKAGLEKPAEFFVRMRSLTLGAYYTTQEGWKQIGYPGAQPGTGPYVGPTPEALAHIKGALEGLGLKLLPGDAKPAYGSR